jgi:hypothetical protein
MSWGYARYSSLVRSSLKNIRGRYRQYEGYGPLRSQVLSFGLGIPSSFSIQRRTWFQHINAFWPVLEITDSFVENKGQPAFR